MQKVSSIGLWKSSEKLSTGEQHSLGYSFTSLSLLGVEAVKIIIWVRVLRVHKAENTCPVKVVDCFKFGQ